MAHFLRPLARLSIFSSRALSPRLNSQKVDIAQRRTLKPWIWGTAIAFTVSLATQSIYLDSKVPTSAETMDTIIDPATSIAFPTQLRIPAKIKTPTLSLLGVGVKTVTFLKIKVYSVGFYVDLKNPNLNITGDMSPDEKISHLVKNAACVIRIVPTRTTSYTHLRDAFMRAMQTRMILGRQRETLSDSEEQAIQSPLRKFKSLFPNTPLPQHTPLDVFLTAPALGRQRALIFRDLGAVESDWVATEFVLAYFEGEGLSPTLKKSIVDGLESLEK